jgi:radical SAM superfamily enzyme YgiQ (UPF0313 family)
MADLLFSSGFETLRLGVESTDFANRNGMDRKITESDFTRAVNALRQAGFRRDQVGAYLLIGLPGQEIGDVEQSVRAVLASGITPVLTHYTPIPKTRLWENAVASSRYPLDTDPLYTNNSIFPCRADAFSWPELSRLKQIIKNHRPDRITL